MEIFKVYKKENCIWCSNAIGLLEFKGLPYETLMYNIDFTKEELVKLIPIELEKITLPQIFHIKNDTTLYVGGFLELKAYLIEKDKA